MYENKIYGTAGNDSLTATSSSSAIYGYTGNDTLTGNFSADYIFGGDGNDSINGDFGDDSLLGGSGNDYLYGDFGLDTINGGIGDDDIDGYYGDDSLLGDLGNDTIYGGYGRDTLKGDAGDDLLMDGNFDDDILFGGDGNDTLFSEDGNDTLYGGNGNDHLVLADNLSYSNNMSLNGDAGDDTLNASGTNGNDTLNGGSGNDRLYANDSDGDHTLNGGSGADYMWGGSGNDTYYVDNINDVIAEDWASTSTNDTVYVSVDNYVAPFFENIEHIIYAPGVKQVPYFIQDLYSGSSWGNQKVADGDTPIAFGTAVSVSYSFVTAAVNGEVNFQPYTDAQKTAVRAASAKYAAVSGLSFVESTNTTTSDIRFFRDDLSSGYAEDAAAYGYFPAMGGELHMNVTTEDMSSGSYGFQTLLHEIGHVVGLKHPHDAPVLPTAENTQTNTVMTYNLDDANATDLGIFDLAALHYEYGVNSNARTGNQTYGFDTHYVWDGQGVDTISASTATASVFIDLTPGTWQYIGTKNTSILATGQTFIGFGTTIENAITGTGADSVLGNSSRNNISTGAGNDTINGGMGIDTMIGGVGNDIYYVNSVSDVITEAAGAGLDSVYSTSNYTLANNVERLTLRGTLAINGVGNALSNGMAGNSANNILNGGAGNDRINGYEGNDKIIGGLGADSMSGGLGNDIYYVDNLSDTVTEVLNEGIDTIYSMVTYVLGANQENLYLQGTSLINGVGNTGNNVISGNASANSINAGAGSDNINTYEGNDILTGGLGNDVLQGGLGNDRYVIARGDGVDTITENDSTIGNADLLWFNSNVVSNQLWFQHIGNDLVVSTIGTTDKVTVKNWYSGSANQVEQIRASDGKILLNSEVSALVDAMAAFTIPAAGQTTLSTTYQANLNPVFAANWS